MRRAEARAATGEVSADIGVPARVLALADRLGRLAGCRWTVSPASSGGSPIGRGLALTGEDPARREVAAGILEGAVRAEAEIASLCGEVVERYEEATLLYRLGERLGAVIGEEAIARHVLESVGLVLGAGSGEAWLHRGPVVERVACLPERPESGAAARVDAFAALYEDRPWMREGGDDGTTAIAVPLPSPGGDPLGLLVFHGRTDGRSYRTGDVKLLTAIAALTSAFIRNARLAEAARMADAKRREDDIARQVHSGLLPHEIPSIPGLDIVATCRAAETVGGDYYGFLRLADDAPGIAMADISGHGVGAALYMAAAKGVIQAEAGRLVSPSDLLRRLNETLAADFSRSDVFATAFIARFDRERRRLDYANGGHNPPLLVRADGTVERLERGGLALGVLDSVLYQEEGRTFAPGDVLVVYTDGLVEARNTEGEFFGVRRLERVVAGVRAGSAADVRDAILDDVDAFLAGAPQRDDVTLVVVRPVREEAA